MLLHDLLGTGYSYARTSTYIVQYRQYIYFFFFFFSPSSCSSICSLYYVNILQQNQQQQQQKQTCCYQVQELSASLACCYRSSYSYDIASYEQLSSNLSMTKMFFTEPFAKKVVTHFLCLKPQLIALKLQIHFLSVLEQQMSV